MFECVCVCLCVCVFVFVCVCVCVCVCVYVSDFVWLPLNSSINQTRPDTWPIRSHCWWAGAVTRVGRGSKWVGGGSIDARQEL